MPDLDEPKLKKGLLFWRRPRPVRQPSTHNSQYPSQNRLQRTLRRVWTTNMTPETPVGEAPGFFKSAATIIFSSWLNLLLFCIPVSWALHFVWQKDTTNTQDTIIFVFSFLSIIPLAKLLAFATDELSLRVGQTLAGLLNATLGNAVELIVSIIALIKCELQIVQSSLVGSVLSNLLLVLGMCFFAGGMRYSEQGFGISAVQIQSSLLILSVVAVLLPAAFHFVAGAQIDDSREGPEILSVSHGASIILLVVYISYLVFQLFSHTQLYDEEHASVNKVKSTPYPKKPSKEKMNDLEQGAKNATATASALSDVQLTVRSTGTANGDVKGNATVGEVIISSTMSTEATHVENGDSGHTEEEKEEPQMSLQSAIIFLIVVTVLVAVTAEFLVSSIDGLTDGGHISKEFVGVILLPIVGNAAEHVTAVTVSVRDKLDLSLGVAVGSSIQIALFVIPFIVTLGWMIGKPLTLLFDPFESIVLFLSVIVVNYTVQDGKSNWLEGAILMCLYVILAVVFWYYPGTDVANNFNLPGCPG
ncbi:Sodium/calcium exchanger protein-domain-containing protein [Irpex rosettiformis]|uniref:Sodium/calcium exchanger protein-domain-containing protein n=1 Tax=Irpex rosettiformis TaxID=378272 RepID=A0ACB8TZW6_9APHY|nr:Sodium/calcium exchanger protein-domain-containing protein [Irpex rosettiformis]